MPEISRFYGIIIAMFADDHNPPHFHVRYGDYDAVVTIEDGIFKGELPKYAVKRVSKWLKLHRDELMLNWSRLQNNEKPNRINPLK